MCGQPLDNEHKGRKCARQNVARQYLRIRPSDVQSATCVLGGSMVTGYPFYEHLTRPGAFRMKGFESLTEW